MPAGRPKVKLTDLPPNWKQDMIDLSLEGGSNVELMIDCLGGISNDLWSRLIKDEPEFSETVSICKQNQKRWWNKQGRKMAVDNQGNATVWVFNMKNRFGWRDKQEITGDETKPIQHKVEVEYI